MNDTPRTETVAFGTDDESLNRLFGIRELPRYVVPVDFGRILERELAAVTADLEFRRELGALQQQEYDKVTAERDVLRADLCAFAVDMERQLSAVTAERDSMVARFRDEINQRQETQRANAIVDAAILSASQQEARRLREALQRAMDEYDNGGKCWHSNEVAGAMRAALSSTPSPVHKDTERLNFCDTMIDLEPGFYVLRFPVTESCTIRDAIDAELARND